MQNVKWLSELGDKRFMDYYVSNNIMWKFIVPEHQNRMVQAKHMNRTIKKHTRCMLDCPKSFGYKQLTLLCIQSNINPYVLLNEDLLKEKWSEKKDISISLKSI